MLVLWCALLATGCEKTGPAECAPDDRALIVYLAADNDLSGELKQRMAALGRGWRSDMELWVYADTPEGASLGLMEAAAGGAELRTVERYGAENSASGAALERVLRTVRRLSPRESFGLLFFSHATGWLPQGTLAAPAAASGTAASNTADSGTAASVTAASGPVSLASRAVSRAVGRDHAEEMDLAEFAGSIPEGMPLDYVVFECCLMAGAEVMWELAGRTEYVLASSAEMLAPGFVPLYDGGLELLASRERPAEEVLTAFGRRYMTHVRSLAGEYRSATLSLVRTEALPALAREVRRATGGFAAETGIAAPPEALQRFDRPGMYGDRPAAARFHDLEQWVEMTALEPSSLTAFRAALAEAVVWRDATERFMGGEGSPYRGFDIRRHSGLTLYIPRAEFPRLNEAYRTTGWWRATRDRD